MGERASAVPSRPPRARRAAFRFARNARGCGSRTASSLIAPMPDADAGALVAEENCAPVAEDREWRGCRIQLRPTGGAPRVVSAPSRGSDSPFPDVHGPSEIMPAPAAPWTYAEKPPQLRSQPVCNRFATPHAEHPRHGKEAACCRHDDDVGRRPRRRNRRRGGASPER
jgi:hypothetical protein